MKQTHKNAASDSEDGKTVRGPELREKIIKSQKKGEEFRAENQGRDAMKTPKTSNTNKEHKK